MCDETGSKDGDLQLNHKYSVHKYSNINNLIGEEIVDAAGYPALIKFILGNPNKPLVIFIPGANHLARIGYGGHPAGCDRDFLAHWLVRRGYSFLGISYPLATANPSMPYAAPEFNARDWGRQAVEIAASVVSKHGLTRHTIVVAWSMGGRIVQPLSEYASAASLEVDLFISLAASPGLTGLSGMDALFNITDEGYSNRPDGYDGFWSQIADINTCIGHEVIDRTSYIEKYVGDMPIGIRGNGLHYRDGKFVRDHLADMQNFKSYAFHQLPLMATIRPDSPLDARHALTDHENWAFMLTNKLYADLKAIKLDLAALPEERWRALLRLIREAPTRLTADIAGGHFFFVGEAGARNTARLVNLLDRRANDLRNKFALLTCHQSDQLFDAAEPVQRAGRSAAQSDEDAEM